MAIYTGDTLDAMRKLGDEAADDFIRLTFAKAEAKKALDVFLKEPLSNAAFSAGKSARPDMAALTGIVHLPEWADPALMKRGAAFFAGHAQAIMNLLALLSLPYCYAAADGARVLGFSERLTSDVPKRLLDTAGFVWQMMAPDAFLPEGKGLFHLVKVRLMHAAVRFYIQKSGTWQPEYGVPVNQEDMTGTNLAFSLIAIRGLRKFGYTVSYAEQQAFMHLWNVIGFGLGVRDDLLPRSGKDATLLERSIRERQFGASAHGQDLTRALIGFLGTAETPGKFSQKQILQLMRYLLGNEAADLLALPKEKISARTLDLIRIRSAFDALAMREKPAQRYRKAYRAFAKQQKAV